MGEQAQRIELPDGTQVWARLSPVAFRGGARDGEEPGHDQEGEYGEYENVGALDRVVARVEHLRGLITGVATSVRDAAAHAAPDDVAVEFGVELAVKSGTVVSMLAGNEASAALKVTLTWRDRFGRSAPLPQRSLPPAIPAPHGTDAAAGAAASGAAPSDGAPPQVGEPDGPSRGGAQPGSHAGSDSRDA